MSVAIAKSPVFSPSRIQISSCKSSPEKLILTPTSPASVSSSSAAALSPFRSRFQREASGMRVNAFAVDSSPLPSPPSLSSSSLGESSVLKRKRPARIDIPLVEAGGVTFPLMGSDGRKEIEVESTRYSVYCKRGKKRSEMEDRYKVTIDIGGDPKLAFFGIFDGHGGKKAAEFASENMGELILDEISRTGCGDSSEIEEAVRIGYLKTDNEFLKDDVGSGACCVTALVRNGNVIVSNVGDCRAVLSRSGRAEAITSDHRPSREDERERIESLGAYVDYFRGTWRLQGSLAVSRGIGDSHLKQWVIPDPETKVVDIEEKCEFLILASDGLWDKVGNQEAVDIARPLCVCNDKSSALYACRKLADLSASRGSVDDTSVMIIQLQQFTSGS